MGSLAVATPKMVKYCSDNSNKKNVEALFDQLLDVARKIAEKTQRLHEIKRLQCVSYKSCGDKSGIELLKRAKELADEVKGWIDDSKEAVATVQGAKWLGKKIGAKALENAAKGAGLAVAAGSAYFSNITLADEDKYFSDPKNLALAKLGGEESGIKGDLFVLQQRLDAIYGKIFSICGPMSVTEQLSPPTTGPTVHAPR